MLKVTKDLAIHENEIKERFILASGPGGQHVNKAATAVQLCFDVAHSPSLPPVVRHRLKRLAGNQMTQEGILIIEAGQSRSQNRNREQARNRLRKLIRQAAQKPKKRRKSKPSRASRERRLRNKRHRSEKKRLRRPPRNY